MYMILQGIGECFASFISRALCLRDYLAPMLWGTLSDTVGRRPITPHIGFVVRWARLGADFCILATHDPPVPASRWIS